MPNSSTQSVLFPELFDRLLLASQPTLSRFENGVTRGELLRMSEALFETVLRRQAKRLRGRVRTVTIDLDVTDDPTHGQQELTFFHGHYGHWCYLPLLAYLTFNGERDQHLVAAMLRPGSGALTMLKRIVGQVQERFPRVRLFVRLDGGFAGPGLLEFLDEVDVDYAVGLPSNPVLVRSAEALLVPMRLRSERTGATEHVYGECRYAAKRWDRERRVIIKAEVVRLFKLGAEVVVSVRRMVLHLPATFAFRDEWCAVAAALGARSG